ncbi:cytochrome C5 [Plantibacter flavus]|uniref:cytochrome C5 n=1 Tax=Plantibacter flavus TaxID=150123 RepID=UPI003F14FB07
MTASLNALAAELARRELLPSPTVEDDFVYGLTRFAAIDAEVMFNVDPEPEDRPELDVSDLADAVERVLAITPAQWSVLIERIAAEVEEAVGEDPVEESTDLRDDLSLMSVVVFADVVLLSFDAPKQFPDSDIRVQLDEELAFDDLEIEDRDADDAETITFESVDALLDHLSKDQ